jgi:hypothetical protein
MNLSPEQQHPDGLGYGAAPAAEDDGDGEPTGNIPFYSKFVWAGKRTQDLLVCFVFILSHLTTELKQIPTVTILLKIVCVVAG